MLALTGRRAAAVLSSDVEVFERLGYRPLEHRPFQATLEGPGGRRDIVARLTRRGRIFGGDWGLELTTADPVLPETPRGLSARGRGAVRFSGMRFRARGGDEGARALAERLEADERLAEALRKVDFEQVSVDASGRPVIRHLGGSLVWVLFPPVIRATPLPPDQARAMTRALDAFAAAGQDEASAHQPSKSRSA